MEQTLAIIKPDAVERNLTGRILERIESNNFKIVKMKMAQLSLQEVEGFYDVHKERPFFADLTKFMSSGPVVIMTLERDNAIAEWRELMGATNPKDASMGTIRREFAIDLEKNSSHGSDSPETAKFEISYFFQ